MSSLGAQIIIYILHCCSSRLTIRPAVMKFRSSVLNVRLVAVHSAIFMAIRVVYVKFGDWLKRIVCACMPVNQTDSSSSCFHCENCNLQICAVSPIMYISPHVVCGFADASDG